MTLQCCLISLILWSAFMYPWGALLFLDNGEETLEEDVDLLEQLCWFACSPISVPLYVTLLHLAKLDGATNPDPIQETPR